MRIKPVIVIVVASLIVGGAIVMAAVQLTEGKPNPPTPRATQSNPWVAEVKSDCIEAAHARLTHKMWHYTSDGGQPRAGVCRLS
jgi:hypothetical protein